MKRIYPANVYKETEGILQEYYGTGSLSSQSTFLLSGFDKKKYRDIRVQNWHFSAKKLCHKTGKPCTFYKDSCSTGMNQNNEKSVQFLRVLGWSG